MKRRRALPVVTESDCKGCGACCRHVGHPMFRFDQGERSNGEEIPDEDAFLALPEPLKQEMRDYRVRLFRDGDDYGEPCFWLQPDGTCKHHEFRPAACRDFEVGSEDCLRFRKAR